MRYTTIDTEKLREDLLDECYAGFFGGGIGTAMIDSFEIERASDEELINIARKMGFNLRKYQK